VLLEAVGRLGHQQVRQRLLRCASHQQDNHSNLR
jgi:hypothetical protein